MIYEAIKNFQEQFKFDPKIENLSEFRGYKKFIVVGMGGSHLAADVLSAWKPSLDLIIHKDYGLPALSDEELKNRLIIVSSYSGNTEEVLDSFGEAIKKNLDVIAISVGGKLIELARQHRRPHILLPDTGIQPRSALGFSFLAMLKATGEEAALEEARGLTKKFDASAYELAGENLAKKIYGYIPVIYSSSRNAGIGLNWRVRFNETGKIPSFSNVFPELNHNEMTGFDIKEKTRPLTQGLHFIFLKDPDDHPRVLKRMEILEKLYKDRNLPVEVVLLKGNSILEKIFASIILADWTAYYAAQEYSTDSENVPMVEEFKKLI